MSQESLVTMNAYDLQHVMDLDDARQDMHVMYYMYVCMLIVV